jgi:Ca2+-transporting ATPase
MKDPYLHPKADVLKTLKSIANTVYRKPKPKNVWQQNGPNQLEKAKTIPAWQQLLHSLKEPLMIILFIAVGLGALSAWYDFAVTKDHAHAMASVYEAIAILLLIMVNAGLSFWQARAAQKSMAALQSMAAHHALVLRDDDWQEIPR